MRILFDELGGSGVPRSLGCGGGSLALSIADVCSCAGGEQVFDDISMSAATAFPAVPVMVVAVTAIAVASLGADRRCSWGLNPRRRCTSRVAQPGAHIPQRRLWLARRPAPSTRC